MISTRLLMCPPDYISTGIELNSGTRNSAAFINRDEARRQWDALHNALSALCTVDVLDPVKELPYLVFTSTGGVVHQQQVIVGRSAVKDRANEETYYASWFKGAGFDVLQLPAELHTEGSADVAMDHADEVIWMLCGHENAPVSGVFSSWFDLPVRSLQKITGTESHLDVAFCRLNHGYLLYDPAAFDSLSVERIHVSVPEDKRLAVAADDARDLACNAVNIGDYIFTHQLSSGLRNRLEAKGFECRELDLGEFRKAGASVRSLTLEIAV